VNIANATMVERLREILDFAREVHEQAAKEYGGAGNAVENFDAIARLEGRTPQQVLMTYLHKHMRGIQAHVNGHVGQREPIRGRIVDAIVYLGILAVMEDATPTPPASPPTA